MTNNPPEHNKKLLLNICGWIVVAVFTAVILEAISFVALKVGERTVLAALIYNPPPLPTRDEYAAYLANRNPVTGWPSNEYETLDDFYIRPVEAFPETADICISGYGDSFVFGSEVEDNEAWSNYLANILDCRPANYGIPAFGTGQALLRFQSNLDDDAPVSFIAIYPFNYARTINQYRPFIGGDSFGWKPRFYIHDDSLEMAPLPRIEYEQLADFYAEPGNYLQHESFLPDSELGPVSIRFPFSEKIARIALKDDILNGFQSRPRWSSLIQPGHPAQAFDVTVAVVDQFMALCRIRNKQCFTVLLPTNTAYKYFVDNNERIIQPMLDEFKARDIAVLDLTPLFYRELGTDTICSTLVRPESCDGHFSPEGNRLFAELIREYVVENELL